MVKQSGMIRMPLLSWITYISRRRLSDANGGGPRTAQTAARDIRRATIGFWLPGTPTIDLKSFVEPVRWRDVGVGMYTQPISSHSEIPIIASGARSVNRNL